VKAALAPGWLANGKRYPRRITARILAAGRDGGRSGRSTQPIGGEMIYFYRSASIAPGKLSSSLTFAKEIVGYLKEKIGIDVTIAMPIGGNPNRIGWASHYENLAAYEATMTKMLSDPKYMELVGKAADNFIAGSVRDELWRSL
jgi:hypothetical protein